MQTISNAVTSSLLLAALALAAAGCGDAGAGSPAAANASVSQAIALESPAIAATHSIPRGYTCDGRDIFPPLRWGALPTGTRELALLILSLTPVRAQGARILAKIAVLWAVAGLAPSLHRLAAGTLPAGAIRGRNAHGRSGYSICPARGKSQGYLIALYALPVGISARPGFSDEALFAKLRRANTPFGELLANYTRAGGVSR